LHQQAKAHTINTLSQNRLFYLSSEVLMGKTAKNALPPSLNDEAGSPYQIQSIDRIVSLMDVLGENRLPLSLTDICTRMNAHKSTVHRALMVLERNGLIERTSKNRFRLGMKLYLLGTQAVEQLDLRRFVLPFVQKLSVTVKETTHVGVLQNTSVIYLDYLEPKRRVCNTVKAGSSNPVYCTALGKAILAFQPDHVVEQVLADIRFVPFTENTITSKEAFLSSLRRVRSRGYAIDDEELEVGVRCIAAPLIDESDFAIAAISASGPVSRVTVNRVPGIAAQVMRCCKAIRSSLLEHRRD
jgi:DNA-binding IclR family transcriptional regulator